MRFKNLDLNLLVVLDRLLIERSVSRTAEKLHITQSATSNALARLREYLGDDLLVQVGRRMELTPRAESLMEPVRDILVRIDSSVIKKVGFDPENSGHVFKIFVSDFSLATLIPHFLSIISAMNYSVKFEFRPQSSEPAKTLERGEADLLIIPADYCSPEHPSEIIFEEEFVCIASNHHPRISDSLTVDQFSQESHVVMQPPNRSTSFETKAIGTLGIQRKVAMTTFNFSSLPYLVASSNHLAMVHKTFAQQAAQSLPIKIMETPFAIPPMEQSMQWHQYRSSDPSISWLRQKLMQASKMLE